MTRDAYWCVEWGPCEARLGSSSFLLTITRSGEVKLWRLPSTLGLLYMEEVGDLTPMIRSVMKEASLVACNCCFLPSSSLVVTVNDTLFRFEYVWKDEQETQLVFNVSWCAKYSDIITSILHADSVLLCGTLYGRIVVLNASDPTSPVSLLPNPSTGGSMVPPVIIPPYVGEDQHREENPVVPASATVCFDSILEHSHPCQAAIKYLSKQDDVVIASDGVHVCCFRFALPQAPTVLSRFAENEGIVVIGGPVSACQLLTTTLVYRIVDLLSSTVASSTSLVPFFDCNTDFSLLGGVCLFPLFPALLYLCYDQTLPKTSTVDYRVQFLALSSLPLPELASPDSIWLPAAALAPTALHALMCSAWEAIIAQKDVSIEHLHLLHITLCRQFRTKEPWTLSGERNVDVIVALRRRLLYAALETREEEEARWIRFQLEEKDPYLRKRRREEVHDEPVRRVCECCKKEVVLNEGHEAWCSLQCIDDYCPVSWKPTVHRTDVRVCSCCYQKYVEGEECVYCGLRLRSVFSGPSSVRAINNQYLYSIRENALSAEWNCL